MLLLLRGAAGSALAATARILVSQTSPAPVQRRTGRPYAPTSSNLRPLASEASQIVTTTGARVPLFGSGERGTRNPASPLTNPQPAPRWTFPFLLSRAQARAPTPSPWPQFTAPATWTDGTIAPEVPSPAPGGMMVLVWYGDH